ncbi:hypothetical protein LZ32DRAFT_19450 [Colletotrichum eremochloae]|nr:hypothetical protein LZ32DRAFT_19450 [Colletotrichum eremochloae]
MNQPKTRTAASICPPPLMSRETPKAKWLLSRPLLCYSMDPATYRYLYDVLQPLTGSALFERIAQTSIFTFPRLRSSEADERQLPTLASVPRSSASHFKASACQTNCVEYRPKIIAQRLLHPFQVLTSPILSLQPYRWVGLQQINLPSHRPPSPTLAALPPCLPPRVDCFPQRQACSTAGHSINRRLRNARVITEALSLLRCQGHTALRGPQAADVIVAQ